MLGFYSIGDVDVIQQSLSCVCVCVCVCVVGGWGWGRGGSCLPHSCSFQGKETSTCLSLIQREPPGGGDIDLKTVRKAFPEPASLPIRLLPLLW